MLGHALAGRSNTSSPRNPLYQGTANVEDASAPLERDILPVSWFQNPHLSLPVHPNSMNVALIVEIR
jgi:hypothetical protein